MSGTPYLQGRADETEVEPAKVLVDGSTSLNVQPWNHQYLHAGFSFYVCVYEAALDNNASIELIINPVSATLGAHMFVHAITTGDAIIEYLRNITSIDGGTPVIPVNRKESSSNESICTVTRDPGTVTGGDGPCIFLVPGGGPGVSIGAQGGTLDELLVKPNGLSSFKLINKSSQAQKVNLIPSWYEAIG